MVYDRNQKSQLRVSGLLAKLLLHLRPDESIQQVLAQTGENRNIARSDLNVQLKKLENYKIIERIG